MVLAKIAQTSEIPDGRMKMVNWGEKSILVINVAGSYYAIDGHCTHMGTDLSGGKLEGSILTCPKHGQRFDVTTGRSILGPKVAFLRLGGKDIRSYQVRVDGTAVSVEIS